MLAGLLAMSSLVAACDTGATPTSLPPTAASGATDVAPQPGGPVITKAKVVVGSKNFTDELLIGEMYALVLENAGVAVGRKLNLGETDIAHEALTKGDIGLYPEYTGTGLLVVLKKDTMADEKAVYDTVKKEYASQFQLTWLDESPMNDTQAIATTKEIADKYNLKTLSDLSAKAPELRLATIPAFQDRPDGIKGLKRVYGGFDFKSMDVFEIGLKYKALLDGKADVAVAFSTDGEIAGNGLVVLQDDKGLWPPYHIAPVVRDDVLASNPKIAPALNALAPKLTDSAIAALNWEVDGKKRDYADVAKEFLQKQGLIK
jgi:osmoprotectant transport system substrate-binding protein